MIEDDITWEWLVANRPELQELDDTIQAMTPKEQENNWYGRAYHKGRLNQLVGYSTFCARNKDPKTEDLLRTIAAHKIAYAHLCRDWA